MGTILKLFKHKSIEDVQDDFNRAYPYLNIEFYDKYKSQQGPIFKHRVNKAATLRVAGLKQEGELRTAEGMTVGELENLFRDKFGAVVQVLRKSGPIWLETSMTDTWTLKQQNDHGRELSEPLANASSKADDFDYD